MVLLGIHEFLPQDRVIFGQPAAGAVLAEAERRGAERVFLVASGTLSRRTGVVDGIKKALGVRFAGLFDETVEHTPRPSIIAALQAAGEVGPDLIVSIGGGSVIDTVKVLLRRACKARLRPGWPAPPSARCPTAPATASAISSAPWPAYPTATLHVFFCQRCSITTSRSRTRLSPRHWYRKPWADPASRPPRR
jgi:alcohol dehydrogenase class IV